MPFWIRQRERNSESPEQEREPKRNSTSTNTTAAKSREKKVRERDSVKDKDKDKDWDRDRNQHRPSHGTKKGNSSTATTKSKEKDQERNREPERDKPTDSRSSLTSTSSSSRKKKRRASMPGSDTVTGRSSAAASFLESRTSLPYPSFSKAHSKEAVGSKEQFPKKFSILTPDPTDLDEAEKGKRARDNNHKTTRNGLESNGRTQSSNDAPPSPPLTSMEQQQSPRKGDTPENSSKTAEEKTKSREGKSKVKVRPASTKPSSSTRKKGPEERAKTISKSSRPSTPLKAKAQDETRRTSSQKTSSSSRLKSQEADEVSQRPATRPARPASPTESSTTVAEAPAESAIDSDGTSIAPNQPASYQTPTAPPENMYSHNRQTIPPTPTTYDPTSRRQTPQHVYTDDRGATSNGSIPPPPPPAPQMPVSIPKVDYLLQNGGLNHHITKNLLSANDPNIPNQPFQPQVAITRLFAPYNKLLDDYNHVLSKDGSLAVATGYRSVARRLLDRLEAVFARDISSETCRCVMCEPDEFVDDFRAGVSWGEVLELVSGRQGLPNWPPFTIASSPQGLGISSASPNVPMQKLDIDIPEEYRDHYERQSRKTKQAVDNWLSRQPDEDASAPDEVDEETLTFAILTHLDQEQRPLFSALLGIDSTASMSPQDKTAPEPLLVAGIAIQRLYRLTSSPRDSETAIFMVSNPNMHNVLATVAAISNDEWDILISGRFDGFLRSGAEDHFPPTTCASAPPRTASRNANQSGYPSRAATPSYANGSRFFRPASQPYGSGTGPSRAPTPGFAGSHGAPIAMDEEAEIAALAEVERDIYLGMEALEDAFEALHCKAETVRQALRERGAGLTIANQSRRTSLGGGGGVEARLGTPASVDGSANGAHWESSTDDGFDDGMSELAPDDSASNVSSNRKRRPKRRNERRATPALVEEDEEEEQHLGVDSARAQRGGRRR